ncbi:NAD(P)H-dependent oxidoreductase [Frigidibacter sp. MR17.14]|uniref:NADPH-dependent FMN reductase n=1 Tax=Frigidibacter sp. MR17.14 TaxID=3126509 RepID=UPI003012D5F6
MSTPTVAVLVGSLRKASVNRRLAENLARIAGDRLTFRFVEIGDLPLYNDELWADPPAAVLRFKDEIAKADAVLAVTPEYNRSFSAPIKNAIDWGSKPMGKNVFTGKPAAAMGATPGALGALAGVLALDSLLGVVGCAVMSQPAVYFVHKPEHHDEAGWLIEEGTVKFLSGWVDAFAGWIAKVN